MDPNLRGVIAESAIANEAIQLGFGVYMPPFGSPRADLIIEVGSRLFRVQCKSARLQGDVVQVRAHTCRRTADGYARGTYSPNEIDLIAAHCQELNRCFALPIHVLPGSGSMNLRLSPARNGQQAGLHFAEHYTLGAIAQLEEHLHGMQGVGGSSPPSSTSRSAEPREIGAEVVGSHEFRNRFGWYMERAAAGAQVLVTHRGRPRIRVGPAEAPPFAAAA